MKISSLSIIVLMTIFTGCSDSTKDEVNKKIEKSSQTKSITETKPTILNKRLEELSKSSIDLFVSVNYKIENGKIYIYGDTNLPTGTKIGVGFKEFRGSDFNIYVNPDGTYTSVGFSNRGKPLLGNHTAEVLIYKNASWQKNQSILNDLQKYQGYNIELGNVRIEKKFRFGSVHEIKTENEKYSKEEALLSESFCYSLQASLECDNLYMKINTEKTIIKNIGEKIRGQDSPYNDSCLKGLLQAESDLKKGLCKKAWENFGCNGKKIPTLLQKSGSLCNFSITPYE